MWAGIGVEAAGQLPQCQRERSKESESSPTEKGAEDLLKPEDPRQDGEMPKDEL